MILKPKLITKIEPGHRFSKGLVGSWLFNEGDGDLAYDTSGNGNHGTLVGDTHSVSGPRGPVLEFDGDGDYVELPNPMLGGFSEITVSAWVRSNIAADTIGHYIVEQGGVGADTIILYRSSTEKYRFQVSTTGGMAESRSPIAFEDTDWHHIVGTYNGSIIQIYVDTANQDATPASLSGTILVPDVSNVLSIAGNNNGWNGQIGSVLIYNRALNAGEIFDLNRDPFQMFKRNL